MEERVVISRQARKCGNQGGIDGGEASIVGANVLAVEVEAWETRFGGERRGRKEK